MILDDESPEITNTAKEDTTTPEDPENNLSINKLKSRLVAMNVDLDTKKHPKSYYLNLYKHAINDLSQKVANQETIINQNKNMRTKGNKILENFMKIKRKRLDKGTAEKYEKSEFNQGNLISRFLVTHENSNLKSADRSSMFDSDTKSKFKSIKVSKISFPTLNDQNISDEENKEDIKVDKENLFEIHELNENEYENVRESEQKVEREIKNAPASKDYDAMRKLSDNLMKLITYNNGGINPLATKYEDIIETTKPMTPKENVTWSSRKDLSRAIMSNLNNESVNDENNSNNKYRMINNINSHDVERKFQNLLEQQQQTNIKKGLSSKYSSKSEALPQQNTLNTFKAPRSSNSMIVVKQPPAKSNSSNSLRRMQIKESIIRTKLNSENELSQHSKIQAANIENENIIGDVHSVTYEITLKLGNYLIIFFLGSVLSIGFYYAYTRGLELITDNPNLLNNISDIRGILTILGVIGLFIIFTYLIRRNKEISKKQNKLVADNCFNGIKNNLLSKRDSGVQSPEIDVAEFIKEYCNSNNVKPEYFNQKIMPLIRSKSRSDNSLEESNFYVDGVIKTHWRLKSDNDTQ